MVYYFNTNHPFLNNIINKVSENIINYKKLYNQNLINKTNNYLYVGKRGVLNLTGPIVYTKVIQDIIEKSIIDEKKINYTFKKNNYNYTLSYTQFLNNKIHQIIDKNHYSKSIKPIII